MRQPPPQRRVAHSSTGVFRAELDEPDSNPSVSESPKDQQLSTRTLNFGWEKLQSAAKARFAKEIQSVGHPTKKKRPYDNTKRAEGAAYKRVIKPGKFQKNGSSARRIAGVLNTDPCHCASDELEQNVLVKQSCS